MKRFIIPLVIVALALAMQLPFLHSDADYSLSNSRGPWTDEGLYTLQLRNILHEYTFSLTESDGLFKAPVFNLLMWPAFKVFGISLEVARLYLIILVLAGFYIFNQLRVLNKTNTAFLLIVLFQFHIFQYSHLALCEMTAIVSFLIGAGLFIRGRQLNNFNFTTAGLVIVILSAFVKIIFLYFLLIIPAMMIIDRIMNSRRMPVRYFEWGMATLIPAVLVIFYISVWMTLKEKFVLNIILGQTEVKYESSIHAIWSRVWENYSTYFFDPYFTLNLIVLNLNIILTFVLFKLRKKIRRRGLLFIFASLWLTIELAKLGTVYLPSRYLLSLITANFLYFCVCLELLYSADIIFFDKLVPLVIFIFLLTDLFQYKSALNRRAYVLEEINNYVSTYKFFARPMMGNWAGSCGWKTSALIKPLAHGYHEIRVMDYEYPKVIITETDEADIERVMIEQGVDLKLFSDSSRTFRLKQWDLVVYWLK